jgi:hypothetical protein
MTLLIAPYHLEVVEERDQFHRKSYCDVLPSDYVPGSVTTIGKRLCHASGKTRR